MQETKEMNDPLPCPFCKSCDVHHDQDPDLDYPAGRNDSHVWFCNGCGAQTGEGMFLSKEAALEAWNRRP